MSTLIGKKELLVGLVVASIGLGFKFSDYWSQHNSKKEWASYARNIKDRQATLRERFSES